MNKIIIYGSHYGTAKLYAQELAKRLKIGEFSFDDLKIKNSCKLDEYETIIYVGALYAGGLLGMAKTFKKISNAENKKIIIVSVGLSDPQNSENTENIKNSIKRQVSDKIFENAKIFHLRGAIDYSKLNFAHKTMMNLLYKKAQNLQEEKKTSEVKALIETYNQKVDFVNFSDLEKIISEVN